MMNPALLSNRWRWHFLNPFASKTALLGRKMAQMRQIREVASLEELKTRYGDICRIFTSLSASEQQGFTVPLNSLRETMEQYFVVHQRMQGLLEDFQGKDLVELRTKYDQLHACLRQLPRDTQQRYYSHLVQMRDRLERGL